jgi:hypothetical protein
MSVKLNTYDYAIVALGFPSISELVCILVKTYMIEEEEYTVISDENLESQTDTWCWPEQHLVILDFEGTKMPENRKKLAGMATAARCKHKKVVMFGRDAKTIGYCRVEARYTVIHKSQITILDTECHLCLDEHTEQFYPLYG